MHRDTPLWEHRGRASPAEARSLLRPNLIVSSSQISSPLVGRWRRSRRWGLETLPGRSHRLSRLITTRQRPIATEALSQAQAQPQPSRWPLLIALGIVFALAFGIFVLSWYSSGGRPTHTTPGWFSFSDQGSYLREAKILAQFRAPSAFTYVYGFGYPIVAVPALWVGETIDPFAPFNALAFAISMVMTTILGTRLRSLAFGVATTALVLFATPLLDLTYVPWSSTVTLLVVTTVLVLATGRQTAKAAILIGLGAGWCLAARYADVLWPLLMTLGTFLRRRREIVMALGACAVVAAAVLWTQWAILGSPLNTPYIAHTPPGGVGISDQNIGAYDLTKVPVRFFGIVTGLQGGQRLPGEALGQRFFWGILAPLGVWFLYRDRHPHRQVLTAAFATSILATIFYLSFRASGAGMLHFGGLHYFKAWFPLWGLLAAYGALRLIELVQPLVLRREPAR